MSTPVEITPEAATDAVDVPEENNDPATPLTVISEAATDEEAAAAPEALPAFYYGIDCVTPLHWPVENHATLWELLAARDVLPSFVGRYIGSAIQSYNLTKPEVAFLHERACAINVVFDGLNAQDTGGESDAGRAVAARVIAAAKEVGIPTDSTVVIYIDVETSWPITVGFIVAVHNAVTAAGYLCGWYGNPLNGSFNEAYSAAFEAAISMRNHSYVWSSEPERYAWDTSPPPTAFAPARPRANGQNTVVWQYQENTLDQLIDRDLATPSGYNKMWSPVFTIITECSGKPTPDHESAAVCRIPVGTVVRRTGNQSGDWREIVTPHGFRVWIPQEKMQPR